MRRPSRRSGAPLALGLASSLLVAAPAAAAPTPPPTAASGRAATAPTQVRVQAETTLGWVDRALVRRPHTVAEVLGRARAGQPLTVVSLRSDGGRPLFTSAKAVDLRAAAALTATALADPTVLGVELAHRVRVRDVTPVALPWALTALGAPTLWAAQSGAGSVVAVVDTGVSATHPDLSGLVLPGLDLVSPCGSGQADGHGHGTHVAGIIAARAGNAAGVAGLAQGTRILPVRALGNDGSGSDVDVAAGIAWAAEHGADVVNLSLGSPDPSASEQAAVDYAYGRGVLVVAAAGNDGGAGDPANYPGALRHVLAVGAVDPAHSVPVFSNSGPYVALVAPGVDVLSTVPPNGYLAMDGTSMAAPFVAATAALMRAANPALTPSRLVTLLESTALDLFTPGRDDVTGYGEVQPVAAVAAAAATRTAGTGASGSAPTVRTTAPTGTTLSLTGAPLRAAFHGTVSMRWRLTAADGHPLAATAITVCRRTGDLGYSVCGGAVTDATGTVRYASRIATSSAYCATYAGSVTQAGAVSGTAAVGMLPYLSVIGGVHGIRLRVFPVASPETATLQRLKSGVWTYAGHVAVPSSESQVVRVSPPGRYRVVVPATTLSAAAASTSVVVR